VYIPGGRKDASVDGAKGGTGNKQRHNPAHHAQQPVSKSLEQKRKKQSILSKI
jgi:hypothetical protein